MDTKHEIKCPACGNILSKLEVDGTTLDVCQDGCGGIWFDNYEMKKFDNNAEKAGEVLLSIRKNPDINPDLNKQRKCPVCPDSTMLVRFNSSEKRVQVDECPTCRGIWLDTGELNAIREQYETEADEKKDTKTFIENYVEKAMDAHNTLLEANTTDAVELKILASYDFSEEEKKALIDNEEELETHHLRKKLDKFAKDHPYLYLSWYIPGKQKGMTY